MFNKQGSALLFVTILLAIVSIVVMLFTRSSTYYYAFSIDRLQHARAQCALNAAAHYGIARCLEQPSSITSEWHESIASWPIPHGAYRAAIDIQKKKKVYKIQAVLFQGNKSLGKITCIVRTEGKNGTLISQWKRL